jgi:broad specificity phosphatase PhoE
MTRLALLRHADTAWSAERRIQGRTDTPLLKNPLLHLPGDCKGMAVVTSPLARCVQTAALLGFSDARREPRIVEMSWGDWEGETLAALRARLGGDMRANEARGLDFRPPNGESPRDVLARVRPWLRELAAAGVPTLAITHKGVIRAIFAEASGWDMTGRPPAKLDWHAAQFFTLDQDGKPGIERLNVR